MSNVLGNLISRGEGGYNSYNRGYAGDAHGQTIDLSTMTLAEVQTAQHLERHDSHRLFAVGKYQIIPDTMDGAVRSLHLDSNQKFTPELQDRVFADYLISEKRPAIASYIRGEPGSTLHGAQQAVSMEWASVDDPDTPERPYKAYIGIGNNHSSIRADQVAHALDQMRNEYQAGRVNGMTAAAAWDTATAGDEAASRAAPVRGIDHASGTTSAGHLLVQGAHGSAVHALQADLARLGYAGSRGQLIRADGYFGPETDHAVEAFQRAQHLTVDGKAGQETQVALQTALQNRASTRLDDVHNPDHGMYQQAVAGVQEAEAERRIAPGLHSRRLAAALVVAAKSEGVTRIDGVVLSEDGNRAFVEQTGSIPGINNKIAFVDTDKAIHATISQSTAALTQVNQRQHDLAAAEAQTLASRGLEPTAPVITR